MEYKLVRWILDNLSEENNEFKFDIKYFDAVQETLSLIGLVCGYTNGKMTVWMEDYDKFIRAYNEY